MFEPVNSFDAQMESARTAYALADMLRAQAARPHLGDELNGRVQLLTLRAAEQERLGDMRAREAFRFAMWFQFAS